jgi:hypothetical protein
MAMAGVDQMDDVAKAALGKQIITEIVINAISSSDNPLLADFYAYCNSYYGSWGGVNGEAGRVLGFLNASFLAWPSKASDTQAYVNAVMNTPAVEFEAQYSAYPNVMAKYGIMVEVLTDLGVAI